MTSVSETLAVAHSLPHQRSGPEKEMRISPKSRFDTDPNRDFDPHTHIASAGNQSREHSPKREGTGAVVHVWCAIVGGLVSVQLYWPTGLRANFWEYGIERVLGGREKMAYSLAILSV